MNLMNPSTPVVDHGILMDAIFPIMYLDWKYYIDSVNKVFWLNTMTRVLMDSVAHFF